MAARISQEDANILYNYIIGKTGYTPEKVRAILKDYASEMGRNKHSLPDKVAAKLRAKWGLSDTKVICNVIALVLGTVGAKSVRTVPSITGGRDIVIE